MVVVLKGSWITTRVSKICWIHFQSPPQVDSFPERRSTLTHDLKSSLRHCGCKLADWRQSVPFPGWKRRGENGASACRIVAYLQLFININMSWYAVSRVEKNEPKDSRHFSHFVKWTTTHALSPFRTKRIRWYEWCAIPILCYVSTFDTAQSQSLWPDYSQEKIQQDEFYENAFRGVGGKIGLINSGVQIGGRNESRCHCNRFFYSFPSSRRGRLSGKDAEKLSKHISIHQSWLFAHTHTDSGSTLYDGSSCS